MTATGLRRVAGALLVAACLTLTAGSARGADGGGDIPLSAEVKGTTTTAPTTTGSGVTTGSTTSRRGTSATGTASSPAEDPDAEVSQVLSAGTTPVEGSETVGGVLAIGGLRTTFHPAVNPLGGTLHVEMTVQNLSDEVISPTVGFTLRNVLGLELAQRDERSLGAIGPGELRVAEADLAGVGQWAVVDVGSRLTVPVLSDGTTLDPVVRERRLLAPPWFLLAVTALVAVGVVVWRLVTRVPAVVGAAAAAAPPAPAEPVGAGVGS